MEIIFRDIPDGFFNARVVEIKEKKNCNGIYWCIIFCIVEEGELNNFRVTGVVKPSPFRQSRFYRWISSILDEDYLDGFCREDLLGKECRIYLSRDEHFYSVSEVMKKWMNH
jgi:hypothetical protein